MTEPTLSKMLESGVRPVYIEDLDSYLHGEYDADSGVLTMHSDGGDDGDTAHDLVSVEKLLHALANLSPNVLTSIGTRGYSSAARREIWRALLCEKLDASSFED